LGALLYLPFRVAVRVELERAGHWQALGLFELKEHFVAIGLALLPAYRICWREKRADKFSPIPAAALTLILAFIVWWSDTSQTTSRAGSFDPRSTRARARGRTQ
jgi:hypothetical protein